MRFVQACGCSLEDNKAAFVHSVAGELADDDPNIVFFKGRRRAYAMKVVFGQRFLMAVTDQEGIQKLSTLDKIQAPEEVCLEAYKAIISDMKPEEHAKFCKMFDIKVLTGFMAAKKILGSCLGLDLSRRDKKGGRKHYTTLVIQQADLRDIAGTQLFLHDSSERHSDDRPQNTIASRIAPDRVWSQFGLRR